MIEKIFNLSNYETKENDKILYQKPKSYDGVYMSKACYYEDDEKSNLCFETDKFILENGIRRTQNGNSFIDIWMNEDNIPLSEFISELDELNITKVWQNSKKWFGQQLDLDMVDSYYKFPLRTNGKASKAFYRLKISPNVIIRNQFGKKLNFENIHHDSIVKSKIEFEGIRFEKKTFSPVYTIIEIVYYQQRKKENNDFQFCESTDTFPEMEQYLEENEDENNNEDYYAYENNNERNIEENFYTSNPQNNEEEKSENNEQLEVNEDNDEEYDNKESSDNQELENQNDILEENKEEENKEEENKLEENKLEENKLEEKEVIDNLSNNELTNEKDLESFGSINLSSVLSKNIQDVLKENFESQDGSENSYGKVKKIKKEKKIVLKGFRKTRTINQSSSYL